MATETYASWENTAGPFAPPNYQFVNRTREVPDEEPAEEIVNEIVSSPDVSMTQKEKDDAVKYVQYNPDLRENAEAGGLTRKETEQFGHKHYEQYGKNEGRLNEPGITRLESAKDEVLGPEHYQDRDVKTVFQASVRAAAPSEMWQARGLLGEGTPWQLDQFTAEGWNYDPDRPYGRGLLADTIRVDAPVGQIWSEGDKRFLQDRYVDAAIANDFPINWVGPDGSWKGPQELAGYWSDMTNAIRNEAGELRAIRDRPDEGWATASVLPVGQRWSGNVRPGTTIGRPGTGVGGVYAQTPYTQPAPQDWSALRYTYAGSPQSELGQVTQTPASLAMFGPQGRAMQPWATGQQVPAGLLNYQVPGGAPANVGYSNPNLGLFDFNNQQNNQQLNNQTNQQVDWSGVPVRGGGDPYSSFEDFTEREYQRMYPGSREMANAAGFSGLSATRLNPAYRDYQQGNVNQMISAGVLPAGSTSYGSGDWRAWTDRLATGSMDDADVANTVTASDMFGPVR